MDFLGTFLRKNMGYACGQLVGVTLRQKSEMEMLHSISPVSTVVKIRI